jgi:outer membrane protein TolC
MERLGRPSRRQSPATAQPQDSARKAYEGAVLQQRAGLITTLDVLDLARELLLARSNSNTAIASAYLAKARVLAAAGALERIVADARCRAP